MKNITRLISFILIVLSVFCFGYADDSKDVILTNYEDGSIIDRTVLDTNECKMTVVDSKIDRAGNYVFDVYCENKTVDKHLIFTVDKVCLNQYMFISAYMEEELKPETCAIGKVVCYKELMDEIGLDSVDEIMATYGVCTHGGINSACTKTESVNTHEISARPVIPERKPTKNEKVIVDNDVCSFIVLDKTQEGENNGYMRCFFENKTNEPVNVVMENVLIDGMATSYVWTEEILPHAKYYARVYYNGQNVNSVAFDYLVYDKLCPEPCTSGHFSY